MGFLEDLFGGGITEEDLWMPAAGNAVSSAIQAAALFDRAGTVGYDMLGNGFPNFSTESYSGSSPSDFYGLGSTGTLSGPEAYFAGRDEVWSPSAQPPSAWDSFNNGLQKIGDFTSSKGGQFLMGGIGGLASYFDAKKRNALVKQMMEQAAAERAARAAKSAQYDSPARVTNMKTALPSWGAGTQAFSGNSLRAMVPRTTGTMYAAKGGYIPGEAPGQSDKVPAMLSDGEFVMDADTVSALGDGNNAAGASALEKMRQNIRRHKRSAPVNKIPPKAKKPEAYLKGAK